MTDLANQVATEGVRTPATGSITLVLRAHRLVVRR
jgi:hypothetical protein